MAAFDKLIEEEGFFELFHLRGELARVLGTDAIILSGRKDERLGICCAGLQLVVGRNLREKIAFRRHIYRTVLGNPACAGLDVFEPQHIEQRYVDNDRVPQFRPLRHLDSHQ